MAYTNAWGVSSQPQVAGLSNLTPLCLYSSVLPLYSHFHGLYIRMGGVLSTRRSISLSVPVQSRTPSQLHPLSPTLYHRNYIPGHHQSHPLLLRCSQIGHSSWRQCHGHQYLWSRWKPRDFRGESMLITYSLTHSRIHSLTLSLTHSFTHSLTHSLIHSLTHSFTHSLTHSLTHLLTPTLIIITTSPPHHPHHLPSSSPQGKYSPKVRAVGYVEKARSRSRQLVDEMTAKVKTSTSSSLFNAYVEQVTPYPINTPYQHTPYQHTL